MTGWRLCLWYVEDRCTEQSLLLKHQKVPWIGLSAACLGGSFQGVGVHETLLDASQQTNALMVIIRRSQCSRVLVNVFTVVLALRGLLVHFSDTSQAQHLILACPHCRHQTGLRLQPLRCLCAHDYHEPHRALLHCVPVRTGLVGHPPESLTPSHSLLIDLKIRLEHQYSRRELSISLHPRSHLLRRHSHQHCNRLVLRVAPRPTVVERSNELPSEALRWFPAQPWSLG